MHGAVYLMNRSQNDISGTHDFTIILIKHRLDAGCERITYPILKLKYLSCAEIELTKFLTHLVVRNNYV